MNKRKPKQTEMKMSNPQEKLFGNYCIILAKINAINMTPEYILMYLNT